MRIIKCGMLFGIAIALQACAADRPVGVAMPVFGDAVRANIAVQTVNPMAPTDRGPLVLEGQRAARQQERYVGDMVERPAEVGTLQGLTGGGGGAGGGGAGGAAGGSSSAPAQ